MFNRVWPLVVFCVPGVSVFGSGLFLGYLVSQDFYTMQIYHHGWASLSVGMVVSGLLAFFAGWILSALNDIRGKLDDWHKTSEAINCRTGGKADMIFEDGGFIEMPARAKLEIEQR